MSFGDRLRKKSLIVILIGDPKSFFDVIKKSEIIALRIAARLVKSFLIVLNLKCKFHPALTLNV